MFNSVTWPRYNSIFYTFFLTEGDVISVLSCGLSNMICDIHACMYYSQGRSMCLSSRIIAKICVSSKFSDSHLLLSAEMCFEL